MKNVFLPEFHVVINKLNTIAKQFSTTAMLSLTHGQSATPTTFGKELSVFVHRLKRQYEQMKKQKTSGEIWWGNWYLGCTLCSIPQNGLVNFSKKFISSLGLDPNLVTTQIEPHDSVVESYHSMIRVNNILIDLCRDVWSYVSRGILKQKRVPGRSAHQPCPIN